MPALLRTFVEQVLRPGIAIARSSLAPGCAQG